MGLSQRETWMWNATPDTKGKSQGGWKKYTAQFCFVVITSGWDKFTGFLRSLGLPQFLHITILPQITLIMSA